MAISTSWISHLRKKESRESFTKAVINALGSDLVIDRLRKIIKHKLEAVDQETTSDKQFFTESWAFWRANADGKKTAYQEVLKLLETPNE